MAKKRTAHVTTDTGAPATPADLTPAHQAQRAQVADLAGTLTAPVALRYIGPAGTESPRYGPLTPGRVYEEDEPSFAAYLLVAHPDHWERGD